MDVQEGGVGMMMLGMPGEVLTGAGGEEVQEVREITSK